MYEVMLKQETPVEYDGGSYTNTDKITIVVKSVEEIESIIGIFVKDNISVNIKKLSSNN